MENWWVKAQHQIQPAPECKLRPHKTLGEQSKSPFGVFTLSIYTTCLLNLDSPGPSCYQDLMTSC